MYDSEVMCLKKVDTPWFIYRVFTVLKKNLELINGTHLLAYNHDYVINCLNSKKVIVIEKTNLIRN
jgi:hypothetical protein